MGASDSPSDVLITSVNADGFTYRDYPFDGQDHRVVGSDVLFHRDLILDGTRTEVEHLRRLKTRGLFDLGPDHVPSWAVARLAELEGILRGEAPTAPEGGPEAVILARKPVHFELAVVPGTDPALFDEREGNDPWYAAESYGGVASTDASGETVYEVHGNLADARRAKADPRFRFLRCVSRSEADEGAPVPL